MFVQQHCDKSYCRQPVSKKINQQSLSLEQVSIISDLDFKSPDLGADSALHHSYTGLEAMKYPVQLGRGQEGSSAPGGLREFMQIGAQMPDKRPQLLLHSYDSRICEVRRTSLPSG